MDLAFLQKLITENIQKYHLKSHLRYINICFSSKDLKVVNELTRAVRIALPGYQIWDDPSNHVAPDYGVGRKKFLSEVKKYSSSNGLIIQKPEQWFVNWQLTDKQAFWSDRSLSHGSSNTIIVFADSDEFRKQNINYYKEIRIDGIKTSLWLPIKATN
ncbi:MULTISPECIES: hypothetical protein [unclassified Colwellia]|uniref:hypothetical protein n=1 Tax=unclassified Colwellia TaxID=196834 RepID=UPI0015F6D10E|nr:MULTISPECIES: hypothetical protein [unclassified Colwellia]MBA6358107.1 hypothetical protein [Colwellia sp. BRX8-3]MBA6360350.1 hypothetical protein [Colwellia sp. BRX8-6]MBA6367555.1 hypothetical protein [Colwellia sp. BRX8-5]MBA6376441.1 hypothetical protein [Colwellia sp. BRX8-2]